MNLSSKFKELELWFSQRQLKPKNDYLNLDGSRFGAKGVGRYLESSSYQLGMVAGLTGVAVNTLAIHSAAAPVWFLITVIRAKRNQRTYAGRV